MDIHQTPLPDCFVITPARHGDARGFFCESWNWARMAAAGLEYDFVQDNHSFSSKAGTVRGLHYQSPPHAQAKLVRCGRGALYDVAVDVRRASPTYGQWFGAELSFDNGKQLLIPAGFLHGFMALTPNCEILYKCSDYYAPECDGAVAWDDPDIAIAWPNQQVILSEKDKAAPRLKDFTSPFTYERATP